MTAGTDISELVGQNVLVGLTGGIACYKVVHVVSALAQADVNVTVLMTESATRFVTPLTFQALSGHPVYVSPFDHIESHDPQHIALAREAAAFLIAPCSMNMLAKLSAGLCDDVVSLVAAALDPSKTPVLLAPSMNAVMYNQPSTQRNLKQLARDNYKILDPAIGWQACRTDGVGRLPEPDVLLKAIVDAVSTV